MNFEAALRGATDGEVRFSDGDRALYANDASNYRHVPRGVFIPQHVEDIAKAIRICAKHRVPVVHRGGGTALAGQTVGDNVLIIDSSKYCHGIVDIDPEKRLATIEPGCVLDDLRNAANEYGLTFGPDPSTHSQCTLGGMIGNNSCGVHSVMAGRTLDNVHSLEVMTYDGVRLNVGKTTFESRMERCGKPGREGDIYRRLWQLQETYAETIRTHTPKLPRLVSGYRLEQLLPEYDFNVARALVGSESTCVTVLRATVELVPDPEKVLIIAGFDSLFHAADIIPDILELNPIACEAMDDRLIRFMEEKHLHSRAIKTLPDAKAWLLIEVPGDTEELAREKARQMKQNIERLPHVTCCEIKITPQEVKDIWEVRKSGLGATSWVPSLGRSTWPGWEDSAVPPRHIGEYIRRLQALLDDYQYHASMYGHFGDGLIHMRVDFGLETQGEVDRYRAFVQQAANLVVSLGGSLSGEHGDGQARSELLPTMYDENMMRAFGEFKAIWDPDNLMNPGQIVAPRKITENLRFGPDFRPPQLITVFNYPDDQDDFRHAAIRCVGVGECRRKEGGTMCPSYRATREEKHATRGRARLLQEMLQADPISDGWRSDEIHDSLNLCLACKACKGECPVNVDMATYKAEFFYHYYRRRLRPAVQYAVGNIPFFAKLGALAPTWANWIAEIQWAKRLIGVHPQRTIPKLAKTPFRKQWRGASTGYRGRVILWTDTFNNFFSPQVLDASREILEKTGYRVDILDKHICCGRPYYDFGMLDKAKNQLQKLMACLAPILDENTYVVGIEPSCISVFRDEIINMFPDDERARKISERAMMLGDFLQQYTDYRPPGINRKILVHGHCHHKTVLGMDADNEILKDTGADINLLDSGCCGMGGSFGYEKEKYIHSVNIAKLTLIPSITKKDKDDIVITNGFSCRCQLSDLANIDALTLPEFLTGRFS